MNGRNLRKIGLLLSTIVLVGCISSSQKTRVAAPLPPLSDTTMSYANIQPAAGHPQGTIIQKSVSQKSCSFSSAHRKNTVGYALDDSRHISFTASPSFDAFNPSDFDIKVGLRFTKSLGGPAKKRPKCTYSGYYGLLPYAMNNKVDISGLANIETIRSYAQERMDVREQRRLEKEKNNQIRGL
jgi:hypothetical protein